MPYKRRSSAIFAAGEAKSPVIFATEWAAKLGVPKPGCFKAVVCSFYVFTFLHSSTPSCTHLRSFADLHLRSFAAHSRVLNSVLDRV